MLAKLSLVSKGLIGVAFGSMFGGPIILHGRRKAIFIMSALMLVGITMTLIFNYPSMVIGRFVTGFCAGVFQSCNIKAVQETVPTKYTGFYGSFSGAFLAFGAGLATLIGGVSLPTDEALFVDDEMWRLTYAVPLLWVILQVSFILFVFKYEPVDFSIKKGDDASALKFLPMLFDTPKDKPQDQESKDQFYRQYVDVRRKELMAAAEKASKITFRQALFGQKYYRATWWCFGLSVMNQVSAIGPVCIFSGELLKEIKKETNGDFPITVRDGVTIVGMISFISAVIGILPARFTGRIPILTSSHLLIAITHGLIAVLYEYEQYIATFVMIQVFIFWFYIGTGNVSFIYCGEACVDQAMGFVLGARWLTEIAMSYTISFMIDSPLRVVYTFVVYAGLNLLSFIYFCLMKETRGKTPLELEELYWPKHLKTTAHIEMAPMGSVAPEEKNEEKGEDQGKTEAT